MRTPIESASAELRSDHQPLLDGQSVRNLESAEARYREIAAAGGWPIVPKGRAFRAGDGDPRTAILGRRLLISGDLPRGAGSEGHADTDEIISALQYFQSRHGLRPTGVADEQTIDALNVTAETRLAQLRINMARLRDLVQSAGLSHRYILVNIPAFQLEAVSEGQVVQRHRAIVGRVERPTPSVMATVKNVNFYPFWNVPESVARLDLIPHVQKDPDYLQREHIRILSNGAEISSSQVDWASAGTSQLKFRQDPGPWNALGLIRLDMPNEHTVYLHDTPLKDLFGQRYRAMSAGCVRVENVSELAAWVLRGMPGWDLSKIDATLSASQPLDVALNDPVPVLFVYVTAWADVDGRVEFRSDLYGHDGIDELVASYTQTGMPKPAATGQNMSP